MKTFKLFALVGIFLLLIRPLPTYGAQLSGDYPNYVVIGAFKYHRNAVRLTGHAQKDFNLNARYEMNPNRNLYYVYVLNTADRDEAIIEARRLRDESEFKDTWVYSGYLGKNKPTGAQGAYSGVDINPLSEKAITPVTTDGTAGNDRAAADKADLSVSDTGETESGEEDAIETSAPSAGNTSATNTATTDTEIDGKQFFFRLSRIMDNQTVDGDVDVIDQERLRKIGSYKGNTAVRISNPPGKSGKIAVVCEVFGYRKQQRDLNYNSPEGEGIELSESGEVTVPFELVRLQKGDIAIMYNVYFFKDAAVMRPESRFEVNSLLEMLRENEKYKIRIHGHTNGNASGKIIYLDEGSDSFFSLTKTKEGFGSAKKLSQERAELIRRFLVSNGVDPARMQIRAWGGKRSIHDKHSTRAQENVRVEIEILDN
jgi:outer membrane protein OmpA-like peptidoglycan-associated protein